MADVDKRERDGKLTWVARWRDPDGRQRKRSFAKQKDAERFLVATLAALHGGVYVDPSAGKVTVTDYARRWAATRPHRDSTKARTESLIATHLEPSRLGRMPLATVRHSDVQGWASALELAPSTARQALGLVRSVFKAAVLDRLIGTSPAVAVKLSSVETPELQVMSPAEVLALAAAIHAPWRAAVVAQAGLGLRVGELLALRPVDVAWLRREVTVTAQVQRGLGRTTDMKTPRSSRKVPLPAVVAEELARHIAAYGVGPDDRLFPANAQAFNVAIKKAAPGTGWTSHDLRHHYASVLLDAGESVVVVARRLGHKGAALVLSTYGHLLRDTDDRTRDAIDRALRAPDVPQVSAGEAP